MAGELGPSRSFTITFETIPQVVLFRMNYSPDDYCFLYITKDSYGYSVYTGRPDDSNGVAHLTGVTIQGTTISGSICGRGSASYAEYLAVY